MFSGAIISSPPLSQQGATRPGNRWALLPSGIASVLCFNCQLTILTQFPPWWFFIYVQCCPWRKPDFDATVNDRWIKGGSIPRSPRANLRIHPSQDYWPTRCLSTTSSYTSLPSIPTNHRQNFGSDHLMTWKVGSCGFSELICHTCSLCLQRFAANMLMRKIYIKSWKGWRTPARIIAFSRNLRFRHCQAFHFLNFQLHNLRITNLCRDYMKETGTKNRGLFLVTWVTYRLALCRKW